MFNWPLTPPTVLTLLVSLALAIFAALIHWVPFAVPHIQTGFSVLMLGQDAGHEAMFAHHPKRTSPRRWAPSQAT